MGKSKSRNRNKNRNDPTGKQVKPPADPELAAIREQRILPVLKDLQSADLKTRSSAASAITNIIEDQKCRKLLLREQIVKILFEQTLSDSNLETRTAGWGILQNLALEEEADFCVHLYRQDILTAIDGVVKTIIQTIENRETLLIKLPKPQQDLVWTLSSSVIGLVSSLSEAQEEIVESITQLPTIVNFLFGLLIFESTPVGVTNDVLSALTALTEDNKALAEQISKKQEWLNALDKLKDSGDLKSVAACGVLHNVFITLKWFDHNTPMEGASDATLLPILAQAIDTPTASNGTNGTSEHSTPDQILQLALEITASIATSLQEALEHGSKHEKPFEGFDEAAEEIDDQEDSRMDEDGVSDRVGSGSDAESDDEIDAEMEADMQRVTAFDSGDEEQEVEEITLDRLVRIIAPKLVPLASDVNNQAQSSALSALNNVAWTIGSIDFSTGHLRSLHKFWASLAQNAWKTVISPVLASNTADIELASTVTSLAWAIVRSVKGSIQLAPEEQRKFMSLYQASKSLKPTDPDDAFQSLSVKCIGVLGCLALDPAPIELNREIGVFLITTLSSLPETPAADAVEALNALFDIYADKDFEYDQLVFWGNGFYKHLEEIQPKVKKMAKSIDKRKFEELRARSDEVVLNLNRFLSYKKKEKEGKA